MKSTTEIREEMQGAFLRVTRAGQHPGRGKGGNAARGLCHSSHSTPAHLEDAYSLALEFLCLTHIRFHGLPSRRTGMRHLLVLKNDRNGPLMRPMVSKSPSECVQIIIMRLFFRWEMVIPSLSGSDEFTLKGSCLNSSPGYWWRDIMFVDVDVVVTVPFLAFPYLGGRTVTVIYHHSRSLIVTCSALRRT
jgi:hypothetical protein